MNRPTASRIALVASLAAIPFAAAGVLSTAGSAESPPTGRTIHVVSTSVGHFNSSGKFGNGSTVGFRDRLRLDDGTRGRSAAACTIVDLARKEALCNVRFVLPGGELALQLLNREAAKVQRVAVVGGTGAYAGARGSAVVRGTGETADITITLID